MNTGRQINAKTPHLQVAGNTCKLSLYTLAAICILAWVAGCGTAQIYSTINHHQFSLSADALKNSGIAFITPSTVTGQEEERQAVAFTFVETLKIERPDIKCVSLPETLSAINKADLGDVYQRMFAEYKDTGLFDRKKLFKVGNVTGTRYLAQLKLAGFHQGSNTRLGAFGLRLLETKYAKLRLFFQIWDAQDGSIAWEGVQELDWSEEEIGEDAIALQTVIAEAARNLSKRLPE
ncbi:MAG: hypothetical protein GY697_09640 [Desulfobacterales bacterium]|nr:hypothetical protein [Desulfobacterales bacterium]